MITIESQLRTIEGRATPFTRRYKAVLGGFNTTIRAAETSATSNHASLADDGW